MTPRIERAIEELAHALGEVDFNFFHLVTPRDLSEVGTVSTFEDPADLLAVLRVCVERIASGRHARDRQIVPKTPDTSAVSADPEKH